MKQKLPTLLFGLLLAVGWSSMVSAQELTRASKSVNTTPILLNDGNGTNTSLRADRDYADMVTITATDAQALEYTWTDAEGTHTSKATDVATKPEQIYELLRFVYMNPAFPGPSYSAWNATDLALSSFPNRVDPVYYGGIGGGWDIGASYTAVPNSNLTIYMSSSAVNFSAIRLIGDGQVIKDWTVDKGTDINAATGWTVSGSVQLSSNNSFCYFSNTGYITIPATEFSGGNYRSVRVVVTACRDENSSSSSNYISCANFSQAPYTPSQVQDDEDLNYTPNLSQSLRDYGWTITGTETLAADGTYAPDEEGYTALVVSVKNNAELYVEPKSYQGSCSFYSKAEIIEWIGNTIDQVKLLTDGLLIGVQGDYTRGTVFNCDGRYNKFFFLSKGQARKKAAQVNSWINNKTYPSYIGEEVVFKQMFEEFSPTAGGTGDEITNFYSKMNEGSVYDIVHDCASVIQNGHQFSMSGNTGETYYAMSGLNFFIPDYRLAMWWNPQTIGGYTRNYVDGRSFVPYQYYNSSGQLQTYSDDAGYWSANYAQYNPKYAPKVGIYKITLRANAEPVAYNYEAGNRNYKVTLTWTSSLNEMSGHNVPQTYTVYYYDENGQRQKLVVEGYTNTDGETGLNTLVYYVEQFEHSYTIDYIVMGSPDDSDHPAFIAWSNIDGVTIPGWDDFLILKLNHHESDYQASDRANWYRDFLWVDNDVYNGLTLTKVTSGMNSFNLYRWDNKDASEKKIANLAFDNPSTEKVHYKVTYENGQQILETPKYTRATMQVPDEGYVRVRGNGDIIIQPNSYAVSIKSITVKNNGNAISGNSWTSASTSLPGTWILSPGSKWAKYPSGDYYIDGGGYIAIPGILNNDNYSNVTVEIVAYGDGNSVPKVAVNDKSKTLDNNAASPSTYTWTDGELRPTRATRAGEVETVTEDFEDQTAFPPFSAGGITATQHTGVFGDWKLYDSTGETVWAVTGVTFTNEGQPHAWFVYNPTIAGAGIAAHNGDQYLEAICPENENVAADQWLISPLLSGNAQTITFYERIISNYGDELYEVRVSTTDNDPASFTTIVKQFADVNTEWTLQSADLPAGSKYFAIRHYSQDRFGVLIDDLTYERPAGGEAPVIEGDVLRLGNLPIVDQLKETVKDDNTHPDTYHYVLRYEPNGPNGEGLKKTGTVDVNIQKTEVEVHGNYTKAQIDTDTTANLTMGIISADVTMDLRESDPAILYYQMQGKANDHPGDNDWLTQLQQMTSGKYMEMYEGAKGTPAFEGTCDATIHHYFAADTIPGTYTDGDFFCYAPSVSTWGVDRHYFETDGKDNTYGGPLWKTGVGDVEITEATTQKQMKKVNGEWVTNPSTSWTADGVEYTLYFLSTQAQAYLPKATVSNIAYEPYMFRVFVESPSGNLRKFKPVYQTNAQGVEIQTGLEDGGAITGKYCIGSYDLSTNTWNADELKFTKTISNENPSTAADGEGWNGNMKFGAASDANDIKVWVRFYYMTPGWNNRAGDGPDRPGNGAEKGGDPTPGTGIIELFGLGNGEVVSTTYFNALGIQSDTPFDGLNIIVTRYSDGTTSTTKVIR